MTEVAAASAAPPPNATNNDAGGGTSNKRKRRKKKKKSKNANANVNSSGGDGNGNGPNANVSASGTTGGNGGSGGGRKRNRGSKSKNKSKQQKQQQQQAKNRTQVHLPHTKITLRNIQNDEKYGTVSKMVDLLRRVVKDRNQAIKEGGIMNEATGSSSGTGSGAGGESGGSGDAAAATAALIRKVVPHVDIVLDETSIQKLLERERKQQEAELKKEQESGNSNDDDGDEDKDAKDDGADSDSNANENGESDTKDDETKDETDTSNPNDGILKVTENASVIDGNVMKGNLDANVISARVLYMVPPRKSRRRGQISGHCYLALYPPMPLFIQEKMDAIDKQIQLLEEKAKLDQIKEQTKKKELALKSEELNSTAEDINKNDETQTQTVEDNSNVDGRPEVGSDTERETEPNAEPELVPETKPKINTNKNDIVVKEQAPIVITSADRSKALAQARLLLGDTVTSLSDLCNADAKKDQNYGGMCVLTSPSQKIWKVEERGSNGSGKKHYGISSKYEGTIENNEDFKKFIENKKKLEEERLNRPKPQPGGGPLSEITGLSALDEKGGNTSHDGEPVAAIVMHLLEKKAAKKRAKSAKTAERKKAAKAKSKAEKNKKAAAAKSEGEKSSSRGGKKKRQKKKSKNKEASKKIMAAPKILMKKADGK